MGKTKNNRMTVSTFTRTRKAKTMKNVNSKRRSRGGSRSDFVESRDRDRENIYGYEDREDVDNNLEEVDTSEEEENDNRWDFLYNMFSFLF
jgi:hypothetical protein